ncbi:MAG: sulfotransferase domain-containing protein [Halioglobus sp.]
MNNTRATNVDELQIILGKLFTPESKTHGSAFTPRASDVIIAPYSKCGTTWMQQIAHCLCTRGSMAFAEITAVVPWIDAAYDLDLHLDADQVATPRLFKSHLSWDAIPTGGRYICVLRHPFDALVSLYKFFDGWLMESGAIGFDDFARRLYLQRQPPDGYWHHLVSWCLQRDNPNVLLLCYEHLKVDFDNQLPRIASFLDVHMDDELLSIVKEQSSLPFMRLHNKQFDDHLTRDKRNQAMGLPLFSNTSKVGQGASGAHRDYFSTELEQLMAERWRQEVTPRLDWKNYEELLLVIP